MKKRYKILVLIKGLGLGGAERLLVDSLSYLDIERFEYEFAYLLPWKDFLVPKIKEAGFPVHLLEMHSNYKFHSALRRLFTLQRKENYDLIHAHLPIAGVLARTVGALKSLPVFYTEHNMQERYNPITRRINSASYGWNTRVLAVSEEVASSLERSGLSKKTRVVTLTNGIPTELVRQEACNLKELREELKIPLGNLVVGTVAVFSTQKRLTDWLEVARKVIEQRDDVTFVLVGHGPEEDRLRARARELGLLEKVLMPGFRPDGRRVMAMFDVYLMTSEFEGLPVALLEALALARPVVSTSVGGIPEVVEDGREGFLSPVGNVEGLASSVLNLLEDKKLREHMGNQGAEKVEKEFHLKHRISEVERLYMEVLRGDDSSGA